MENIQNLTSYLKHMTSTTSGDLSNYEVSCSCGWVGQVASLSDEFAATAALRHVQDRQYKNTLDIAEQNIASVIDSESATVLTHPIFKRVID